MSISLRSKAGIKQHVRDVNLYNCVQNLLPISAYLTVELLAPPPLVPELHLPSVVAVPVVGGGGGCLLIVVALAPLAADDAAQGFLGWFFDGNYSQNGLLK